MASSIIDFARTDVFHTEIGRRKLGVVGQNDPTADVHIGSLALETPLSSINGGVGLAGCAIGDVLVCVATNIWAKLPPAAAGTVLTSLGIGQVPAYRYPYPPGFYDGLVIDEGVTVTDGGEPVWTI